MVKAYSLEFNLKKNGYYFNEGIAMYESMRKKIDANLENFSINGKINATKLSENWFPQIEADVFISHSHKDFDSVLTLAGYLYKNLDLACFIDSCIWGYSDKLLKAIDERYCKIENENIYDYDLRNLSTSHVHMMLTVALTKMIYNTECLFFLNTPNSILPKDSVKNKTLSPWIYTELSMIKYIEKKSAAKHRRIVEKFSKSQESLKVEYEVDSLNDLPTLTFKEIKDWGAKGFKNIKALDYLYQYLGSDNKGRHIHG